LACDEKDLPKNAAIKEKSNTLVAAGGAATWLVGACVATTPAGWAVAVAGLIVYTNELCDKEQDEKNRRW